MRRLFFLITCCLLIVACTTNKTDYPHSIHFLPSDSSLIIQIDNPNTFKSSFNNNEFLSSFEEPLISERIFKIVEKLHPSPTNMDKFTSDQVHNSIQILRTDTTKGFHPHFL